MVSLRILHQRDRQTEKHLPWTTAPGFSLMSVP
jgi:hypothetical protein